MSSVMSPGTFGAACAVGIGLGAVNGVLIALFNLQTLIATLGTLSEEFVRTARAKGLDEGTVIGRHVARNSLVPVMTTVIGLSMVGLIEGAFFVEVLLGINGIGRFVFDAAAAGVYRFAFGLGKKVLIADTVAPIANAAFAKATGASCAERERGAWLAMARTVISRPMPRNCMVFPWAQLWMDALLPLCRQDRGRSLV